MTDLEKIEAQALINAALKQRNDALDDVVKLVGRLAVSEAQLAERDRQISELAIAEARLSEREALQE